MAKETEVLELRLQIDQFKKESSQAEVILKRLRERHKELKKENKEGSEEYRKNGESIRAVSKHLRDQNRVIDLNKKARDKNRGSIESMRAKLSVLTRQWTKLSAEKRDNTRAGQNLAKAIRKTSDELKRQERAIGNNTRNVGNYTSALGGMRAGLASALTSMRNMLLAGGGVFAFIGMIKSAFSVTLDFSKAQSNLAAILGTTKDQMTELTDSALRYGTVTKFTATQVTELQTELAKLGFTNTEILASTGAILDLAAATGTDLADAAKTTGSTLRAFNLDATETDRVASVLAVSTTKTAASFVDYTSAMSTIAPVAAKFGFSIEETTALFGKLRDSGFDASTSATAFRKILLNLSDANGELAQKLGGTANTFPEFIDGLKKMKEEGIDLGEALELTDVRSVAAFATFIEGADAAEILANNLVDVTDELQAMVDTQLDNLSGDVTLLTSAWEGFILSLEKGQGPLARFSRNLTTMVTDVLLDLGNLESAFTAQGDKTAQQLEKDYDILIAHNDRYGAAARKVIADNDAFFKDKQLQKAEDIAAAKVQFEQELIDQGFARHQVGAVWDEWLKRHLQQAELQKKIEADRIKAAEENAQKEIETERKNRERAAEEKLKDDEKAAKKQATADKKAQHEKERSDAEAERAVAAAQAKEEKIKAIEDKFELERLEKDAREIEAIRQKYEQIIIIINENAVNEVEAERLKEEARIAMLLEIKNRTDQIEEEKTAKHAQEQQKQFDLEQRQRQQSLRSAASTAGQLGDLAEEGSDLHKGLKITETLINTYASATAAFNAMAAIPIVGPVLGGAAAAAATASGLANVQRIASLRRGGRIQDPPDKAKRGKFIGNKGGARMYEAGGNLHSAGGTLYEGSDGNRIEVERDEILTVLNRNSSAMIKRMSDLNEAGGGVSFMKKGGAVPRFNDGGIAAINAGKQVETQQTSTREIREILDNLPPQFVSVTEFESVQNRLRIVENQATAG